MRSPVSLVVLLLSLSCTSSFVLARMNHVSSRTHDHPAIARRQHRLPRLLNDNCIQLEASVLISAMIELFDSYDIDETDLDLFAKADICLCFSSISLFIQTDVRTRALVSHVGEEKVELMLKSLITESGKGKRCEFPEHGIPKHGREHGCDCCEFVCEDTWEKKDDKCICKPPKVECHGKCVDTCGSPTPHHGDKDSHYDIEVHEVVTYEQAHERCDPYDTVCGVESHRDGYDCCDILNNRKNCGGCVHPHPFGSPRVPRGRDCDEIEHRKDSWCDKGKCRVKECEEGWRPNEDFGSCIEIDIDIKLNLDL